MIYIELEGKKKKSGEGKNQVLKYMIILRVNRKYFKKFIFNCIQQKKNKITYMKLKRKKLIIKYNVQLQIEEYPMR